MEQLTNNEIKALQHLADGKQHNDTPKGLTDAQYYTALKSLKEKDMVFAAFICGGIAEAAEIKMKGKAYLDDLASQNNDDFEYDEEIDGDIYEVLEFLSDGEEHFDTPDLDNYDEVCEELEDLGYVDMRLTKDDGIKLTRKGKKRWKAIMENNANHLRPLEFEILNTIRLHEKEIASTEKGTKNIYDYLTLYTKAEITKCSLKMEKKGWIKCFHDDGPAYYHTLLDNGRIVLRKYLEEKMPCCTPSEKSEKNIKKTFSELIQYSQKEKAINRFHELLDGKKGKDVGIILVRAVKESILMRLPTQAEYKSEFELYGHWRSISSYFDVNKQIVKDAVNNAYIFTPGKLL